MKALLPVNTGHYKLTILYISNQVVRLGKKRVRFLGATCPICGNGILLNYYDSGSHRKLVCSVCESKIKGSAILHLKDINMFTVTRTPKGIKTPHIIFKNKIDAVSALVRIIDIGNEVFYREYITKLIEDNDVTYAHLEGNILHYYPDDLLYTRVEDIRNRSGKYLINTLEKRIYSIDVKFVHRQRKQDML